MNFPVSAALLLNRLISPFGLRVSRTSSIPVEASSRDIEIINLVTKHPEIGRLTMVDIECLWASMTAARYAVINNLPGNLVECGVWRGGCALAMSLMLKDLNSDKKVYLYDTFAGMTEPASIDKSSVSGEQAMSKYARSASSDSSSWCHASLEDVQHTFSYFGCGAVKFIKGDVLETLSNPDNLPGAISVLRLDTDWYQSTKKELEVLFPLLCPNGVLLLDDYGHWEGSRKAVDEYFSGPLTAALSPLLFKTNRTARACIKSLTVP